MVSELGRVHRRLRGAGPAPAAGEVPEADARARPPGRAVPALRDRPRGRLLRGLRHDLLPALPDRGPGPQGPPALAAAEMRIVPANEASWEELQTVFGTRGPAARCQCQRYKLQPARVVLQVPGRGARPSAARADRVRTPELGHHQRPGRLPRRRARRLVRGRAAAGVPRARSQQPRPLGGPRRGQGRRQRVGGDVPVHPCWIPQARDQPRARPHRRRLRPRARRPRHRGLSDDHQGRAPGGAPLRHRGHVRRRRLQRGHATDQAPRRDAHRLRERTRG